MVVSQYFAPEPNFISADVADVLAEHCPVTVITARPNYPAGRLADGLPWWRIVRERAGPLTIWRLPVWPDRSRSTARRLFSYLSFLIPALMLAPFLSRGVRLIWVYQTPPTSGLVALVVSLITGARMVFTYADLWPESFGAAGLGTRDDGILVRGLAAFRRWLNRRADVIVGTSAGTVKRFERDLYRGRMEMIPVWVDGLDAGTPSAREENREVVYVGNLGPAQQLDTLIRGFALLDGSAGDVGLVLYGSGSSEQELRELIDELKLTNVRLGGRLSSSEAFQVSTRALAQVVSLRHGSGFESTVPSKLYFAFAASSPLLHALQGNAAELAEESGGGIAFRSDRPESFAAAVQALLRLEVEERDRMRRSLRASFEQGFTRAKLIDRYRQIFRAQLAEGK